MKNMYEIIYEKYENLCVLLLTWFECEVPLKNVGLTSLSVSVEIFWVVKYMPVAFEEVS